MANVDVFLEENLDMQLEDARLPSDADQLTLPVTITGISPSQVAFSHMGASFYVARSDVIDISSAGGPANPMAKGRAVLLVIKANATIRAEHDLMASDLVAQMPFALSRPSSPPRPITISATESAWRTMAGYQLDPSTNMMSGVSVSGKDWTVEDVKGD